MLDKRLLDEEFAVIKDIVFLNAAYVIMPPKRTQEAFHGFMNDYISYFGEDATTKAWAMVDEARKEIAKLINCDPSEVAFVKNTSEGIGIIANGYPYKSGDNVIIADLEHTSNLYGWVNQQRNGLELRVVKSKDGYVDIEDIFSMMDDRTIAVATSTVQFSTGFRIDMDRLGGVCHEKGIHLFVDGIQSAGRLEIDVKKQHIDYLACGGNKGLLGTLGAGFIYCSKEIVEQVIPPYASYQSAVNHVKPPAVTTDFSRIEWKNDARRLESGNLNYAGIAAIKAGVSLINELGIENIESHVMALDKRLRDGIKGVRLNVVTPPEPINYSGIVCVFYPNAHEGQVIEILHRHKIYTTMRGGYIRMAMHAYNTEHDIDEAIAALWKIEKLGE